jgi:hypothetical protein
MAAFANQEWFLFLRQKVECNVCKLPMFRLIRMHMPLTKNSLMSAKYMMEKEMLSMTLKQLASIISLTQKATHN